MQGDKFSTRRHVCNWSHIKRELRQNHVEKFKFPAAYSKKKKKKKNEDSADRDGVTEMC